MSAASRAPPPWLERFQAEFSDMLRQPLGCGSGQWRDRSADYRPAIIAAARPGASLTAAERLAVYNRQYWFRLFGVLHHEYPLMTRLLGAWTMNQLATAFFAAPAPTHPDLTVAADGFCDFVAGRLPAAELSPSPGADCVPARALLQAAAIDQAYRRTFRAPAQPLLALDPTRLEALVGARLRWSPAVALVEEDWPLLRLRRQAAGANGVALPLPAPHARPQVWAICQGTSGQKLIALEPLRAQLMQLLQHHSIHQALARLERACPAESEPGLSSRVRRWLSDGVRTGFWTGIDP